MKMNLVVPTEIHLNQTFEIEALCSIKQYML